MRALPSITSSGMRKPLPPVTRPSAWIPTWQWPTSAKALPSITSSGMRKPLPPTTRPSAWIPTWQWPTIAKAIPLRDLGRKQKRNKPTQEQDNLAILASRYPPVFGTHSSLANTITTQTERTTKPRTYVQSEHTPSQRDIPVLFRSPASTISPPPRSSVV